MRPSTALAVLSALCALLAAVEPGVLLGCPLGFGSSSGNGGGAAATAVLLPSPGQIAATAPPLERRTWYAGAGGGWTGAIEADGEGPLWIEHGGGFAVDGAGDVAEVAATAEAAAEAVARDERLGLLSGPPRQLGGSFVLPGFVDPHVHLIPAGLALTSYADLRGAASRAEFEAGVAAAARRLVRQAREAARGGGGGGSGGKQEQQEGSGGRLDCSSSGDSSDSRSSSNGNSNESELPWLLGGWWDESRWGGGPSSSSSSSSSAGAMPTAAWIDAALERAAAEEEEEEAEEKEKSGGEEDEGPGAAACLRALPVLLSRMDGHMALANRAALRRALLRERERRRAGQEAAAAAPGGSETEEEEAPGRGVAAEAARELLASAPAILLGAEDGGEGEKSGENSSSNSSGSGRFIDARTGLVREAGLLAVARAAPPPTLGARRAALAAAAARLLSQGVTAVGDMGRSPFAGGDPAASWDDLEELYDPAAMAAVAAEGRGAGGAGAAGVGGASSAAAPLPLRLRVAAYLPLETWPRLAARVAARGAVTGPLHAAGVKCFWDGSLGSRTALMTEPYAALEGEGGEAEEGGGERKSNSNSNSTGGNRGVRMVDSPDEAARAMAGADAAGLQSAVHAIGDAAVDEAAAALAAVAAARDRRPDRPDAAPPMRLEHVQHISGEAAARRLAELAGGGAAAGAAALVAIVNPQHLVSDANLFGALPASMRAAGARRTHAWRRLLRAGVPLAIGSDWPVVDLDPWAGLWAAVHRRAVGEEAGGGEEDEEEEGALSAEEAVRASTEGAAYAAGLDAWCGRLVPGLKADFVLLDGSPFAEDGAGGKPRKRLARARPRVLSTFVGGVCRHGGCE